MTWVNEQVLKHILQNEVYVNSSWDKDLGTFYSYFLCTAATKQP